MEASWSSLTHFQKIEELWMDTTIFLTNCLEQYKQKKKESFLLGIMMGSFMAFFVHHHLIYMAANLVCHIRAPQKGFPNEP